MREVLSNVRANLGALSKPAASMVAILGLAICLVVVGGIGSQLHGQQNDRNEPQLQGSWDVTITTTPNPPFAIPFRILRTVGADGVVDAYAFPAITPTDGPLINSAGHGSWKKIGPREFSVTVQYFQLNPAAPVDKLDSIGKVRETIKLSADGKTYTSDFQTAIYLPNGSVAITNSGKTAGRRIQVEPLD
jgi:hypothetical protein